ncbi:MAG: hypothetical protein IM587_07890 [Chitinophagaceae bacterium]|nr:hypothetical protein [Chitinophagaceae bacterium]
MNGVNGKIKRSHILVMKFYRIIESTNLSEVGKYPQCSGKFLNTWDSKKSLVLVFKKKVDIDSIEIPEFNLVNKAKQTDLLSTSFLDFMLVVSPRLKNLLCVKNNRDVQFFRSIIHGRNASDECWIVNPFSFRNEYLDYSRSMIKCSNPKGSSYLRVKDQREFEQLIQNGRKNGSIYVIISPKIYLDKVKEDFFLLDGVAGGIGYYVSETVRKEIDDAGFTGITFSEV